MLALKLYFDLLAYKKYDNLTTRTMYIEYLEIYLIKSKISNKIQQSNKKITKR